MSFIEKKQTQKFDILCDVNAGQAKNINFYLKFILINLLNL